MSATPYSPPDFERFWSQSAEQALTEPLDVDVMPDPAADTPTHTVNRLSFVGWGGRRIYGWFALPREATEPTPGLLWLPVYGFNALPINQYSGLPGFAVLSLNLLGRPADYAPTYDPRTGEGGYMARGLQSRETYVFREFLLSALRGLEALANLPEVDADRLAAAGMSQGGGLSLWLSTLTPRLKAVCADMPFFSDHREYLGRTFARYPYKEVYDYIAAHPGSEQDVRRTLAYFDTLNFAPRVRAAVQVSLGTKDPAVRPSGVESLFAALPEPKNRIVYDRGHEWVEEMPTNNLAWLTRFIPTD